MGLELYALRRSFSRSTSIAVKLTNKKREKNKILYEQRQRQSIHRFCMIDMQKHLFIYKINQFMVR